MDKSEEPSNVIDDTSAIDVIGDASAINAVAVEDKLLPDDQLSWHYILNGKLPSQEDSTKRESNAIGEDDFLHQQNTAALVQPSFDGLFQADGRSEVRTNGKRLSIDLGDVFDDEDKILMTEEDLKKLNNELAKL